MPVTVEATFACRGAHQWRRGGPRIACTATAKAMVTLDPENGTAGHEEPDGWSGDLCHSCVAIENADNARANAERELAERERRAVAATLTPEQRKALGV